MYSIVYEKRVYKDLDKIPNVDIERIVSSIKGLAADPIPRGCKKLSSSMALYRIREGDYRIVYAIDHRGKEVKIVLVRHRKEAYRGI